MCLYCRETPSTWWSIAHRSSLIGARDCLSTDAFAICGSPQGLSGIGQLGNTAGWASRSSHRVHLALDRGADAPGGGDAGEGALLLTFTITAAGTLQDEQKQALLDVIATFKAAG